MFYTQVQNAVDIKRSVTRLAMFQLDPQKSHKAINYSGTSVEPR